MQYRERAHPGHRPDQPAPDQHRENFVHALVIEMRRAGRGSVVVAEPQSRPLPRVLMGDPPAGEISDHGAGAMAGGIQCVGRSARNTQVDDVRWVPGTSTAWPVSAKVVSRGMSSAG